MAGPGGEAFADPLRPSEHWPLHWWVQSYASGWFPMADSSCAGLSLWRSRSRALIPLDAGFRVPRSVRRQLHTKDLQLSLNRSFDAVLHGCARRPDTWISSELASIYGQLHQAGWAHSVEAWYGHDLAAGLLAIGIGGCWIGESMLHHRANAGNVMLVRLVEALRESGFSLFDVQLSNPHLKRFGCREIGDTAYGSLLRLARTRPTTLRLGESVVHCGGWMRE